MGDMADFTLDSIDYSVYNGYEDESGYEQPVTAGVTCRCCRRKNLKWGKRKGKWRLFDNRGIHVCSVNPLKSS